MTKQKAQSNALDLSLDEFRALAEMSPGVHYVCEAFGSFATKFIAPGVKSLFGFDASRFTDEPNFWARNLHPEDKARVFDGFRPVFELGAYSHEYRFLHKDGEYRWVLDELKLLCNDAGEPEKIVGQCIDITGKRLAEDALVQSEERHRRMIEGMKEGVGEIAADGTIIYANERTCEMFGLPRDDLLGLPITDFLDDANRKILTDQVKRRGQGLSDSYEIMWTRRDSSTFWTQSSSIPLAGDDGAFLGGFAVMSDITETKRTEKRLLESEERFRNLSEGSIQGIMVHLGDFRPVFINDAYAKMFGYEYPKEIISHKSLFDLIAPHERDRLDEYSAARKRGDEAPNRYEYEGCKKDGSKVWLENFIRLIDWQGEPAIQSTLIDITKRKKAELALLKSEVQLRLVLDNLPVLINYIDKDQRYSIVNQTGVNWFARPQAEIIGKRPSDIHGERLALFAPHIKRVMAGETFRFEEEVLYPDGNTRSIRSLLLPHLDLNGVFLGYFSLTEDITEWKQAENAVRSSEEKFAKVLSIAPDAIIAIDLEQRISIFNSGAQNTFGYRTDETIGQPLDMLLPDRFRNRHSGFIEKFLTGDEGSRLMSERSEIFGLKKDGTEFPAEASISKLLIGDEVLLAVMLHDISARKEGEIELLSAKEQAEIANRAKSEFLANMSHELRSPLNAILGFSQMLKDEVFGSLQNSKYSEYAVDIHSAGTHLLQVIGDILDISKIEAGETTIEETKIDVPSSVNNCIAMVQTRASEAGIIITTEMAKHLPHLSADERHLKQLLINLLTNAIKFTPAGGQVTVGAQLNAESDIEITVTDTGKGIAAEDIPKILKPFGQVASSQTRNHEGTGLGLSICKSLVELHGGSLSIESAIGIGTTVTIRLPKERIISENT